MPNYEVTIREVVYTTYLVEAPTKEAAKELWENEGSECGPQIDSQCNDCSIMHIREEQPNG